MNNQNNVTQDDFQKKILERMKSLSPAKRALLEQKLKQKQAQKSPNSSLHSIPRRQNSQYAPISDVQKGIWYFEQLVSDETPYNEGSAFHLRGNLNVKALEEGIKKITQRHEILRTTFPLKNQQPIQLIASSVDWSLKIVDLKHLSSQTKMPQVEKLIEEEVKRPFDLTCDLLWRAILFDLAENEYVLLFVRHHIIYDGFSGVVFYRELKEIYHSLLNNRQPQLPQLPIQYGDFTAWQQQQKKEESYLLKLNYWQEKLKDAPILKLPTDYPRPYLQTFTGKVLTREFSEDLLVKLKTLSYDSQSTLFMVLFSAFTVLLYQYSGQDDICVGTPYANRQRAEIQNLIGFFVATLVLRVNLSNALTFIDLLEQVKKTTLEAYNNPEIPYEELAQILKVKRNPSYSPWFQVLFILQNTSLTFLELENIKVEHLPVKFNNSKFDLLFSFREVSGKLKLICQYNNKLFKENTVSQMLESFQLLLEKIADNPEMPIFADN